MKMTMQRIIAMALVLLIGPLLTSCSQATPRPTKQQWKASLAEKDELYRNGRIVNLKRDEFVRLLGEPDKTQTVGDQTYWYYECSDGQIQLVLDSRILNAGFVSTASSGGINEY